MLESVVVAVVDSWLWFLPIWQLAQMFITVPHPQNIVQNQYPYGDSSIIFIFFMLLFWMLVVDRYYFYTFNVFIVYTIYFSVNLLNDNSAFRF